MASREESATDGVHTAAATDEVEFPINAWLPVDTEIYALVHDTQAAGRQFIAYSDPSYQRQEFQYTAL